MQKHQLQSVSFEKILDASPGHFYWKDIQGIYWGCNQRVVNLAGVHSKAEVIGKTDHELWSPFAAVLQSNDRTVIKAGHVMTFEESINGITNVSVKTPLTNEQGEIIGIIGNSFDITHLKNMEIYLKETQEIAEAAKILSQNKFSFFKPWKNTHASEFLNDNIEL